MMNQPLNDIIDLVRYPLGSEAFRRQCLSTLREDGALVLPKFLLSDTITSIQKEGVQNQPLAYYTANCHNIYLTQPDPDFTDDHPRNREVASSKGCITSDQIPTKSALQVLYHSPDFRDFLCAILGENELHEYADPLSSINLHYADAGQELGWHFDNSSFAITLMIQSPESGGVFEFVKDVRNAEQGEMNYALAGRVLDGAISTNTLAMEAGALVLFRGRNSMHRVTPVAGKRTRMLVVLAYNTEPGISLSESARKTFYGRLE